MSTDVFAQRYCIGYFENAVILKMGALRANRQRTRVKSIQNFSVMFRVTSESSQIRIERSIILFIMIINTTNIINHGDQHISRNIEQRKFTFPLFVSSMFIHF